MPGLALSSEWLRRNKGVNSSELLVDNNILPRWKWSHLRGHFSLNSPMTQTKYHCVSSCVPPPTFLVSYSYRLFTDFIRFLWTLSLYNRFETLLSNLFLVMGHRKLIGLTSLPYDSKAQAQQMIDTHTCRRGQRNVDKIRSWKEHGGRVQRTGESKSYTKNIPPKCLQSHVIYVMIFMNLACMCVCVCVFAYSAEYMIKRFIYMRNGGA